MDPEAGQYKARQELLKDSAFKLAWEWLRIGEFPINITEGKYHCSLNFAH